MSPPDLPYREHIFNVKFFNTKFLTQKKFSKNKISKKNFLLKKFRVKNANIFVLLKNAKKIVKKISC